MNLAQSKRLFEAIKAGKLQVTQRNAKAVKDAWAESVFWEEGFKQAKLDHLPDPDGLSSYADVFEAWLVKAYRGNFKSEDETRAAIHSVRDKIISSLVTRNETKAGTPGA